MQQDRSDLLALRQSAREQLSSALTGRLGTISGLTVISDSDPGKGSPTPDAALRVSIDRVGAHTGASREVWMRAVARLETGGRTFGPFYAIGQAVSPKWLIKPGYVWADPEIMAEAARQSARQLVHSLRTGVEALFVRKTRVAVFPALAPASAEKVFEGKEGETTIAAGLVGRLGDVLFQPSLTPLVEKVTQDEIERERKKRGIPSEGLWAAGNKPDLQRITQLGQALKVDYVFVSRIGEMTLEQKPAVIQQFGLTRDGNEVRAEVDVTGSFIRVSDSRILWSDRFTGSSVARTQFTRHGPRIRRDEQCLADAARVGYTWLRSSFENYKRQFER